MAFPFLFEENFEDGTLGNFDSETDTGSLLNYIHYSKLAGYNPSIVGAIAPWRGAFVAEWNLGDTNDHILIDAALAIANGATAWTRFYIFLGKNLQATADDVFSIYELQGTANAQELVVALQITAATGAIKIGSAQTQAGITFASGNLDRGRWYCIEVKGVCQTGAATGTSEVFLDGTSIGSVTNAAINTAIVRGALGTQDTLATTTGYIFMDRVTFDELRIGGDRDRYPETIYVTKTGHICLGDSRLENVTLLPGAGTNNVLTIFDTDKADIADEGNVVALLYNLTASEPPIDLPNAPVSVKRGAYVVLAGTNPRAIIQIGRSQGYYSHGRVRQHGINRSQWANATQ